MADIHLGEGIVANNLYIFWHYKFLYIKLQRTLSIYMGDVITRTRYPSSAIPLNLALFPSVVAHPIINEYLPSIPLQFLLVNLPEVDIWSDQPPSSYISLNSYSLIHREVLTLLVITYL